MLIKTITHNTKQYTKERKGDPVKRRFIKNVAYHPFAKEREYMRALNATKIERLLAKPFVTAFSDHKEGIFRVEKHPSKDRILSSSFDGDTKIYDISCKKLIGSISTGMVSNGVSFFNDNILVSKKQQVLMYDCLGEKLKETFITDGEVNFVHGGDNIYAATSNGLNIIDPENNISVHKYRGNYKFCRPDHDSNLIICASMANIVLIDNRIEKEFMSKKIGTTTNYAAFSPDSQYFITGNEDTNSYLHDLRYTEVPTGIFRHHVNAVMSVDYSPCGLEFVSASYDKTIRIFKINERKSRDVYYNKRMHHVNGIKYVNEGKFIVSGSDDASLRVWKSNASKKLEKMTRKESEAYECAERLKEKYKNVEEIARISKHRFLPKRIKGEMKNQHEHYLAEERKKERYLNREN